MIRDDYCDGLGHCLPSCPTGALSFETRKALPFDKEEVKKNMEKLKKSKEKEQEKTEQVKTESVKESFGGCSGSRSMSIKSSAHKVSAPKVDNNIPSMLGQWPVQLQLVPANAPYFSNADLLIAADCTAFSYGNFHSFMKNKVTLRLPKA